MGWGEEDLQSPDEAGLGVGRCALASFPGRGAGGRVELEKGTASPPPTESSSCGRKEGGGRTLLEGRFRNEAHSL